MISRNYVANLLIRDRDLIIRWIEITSSNTLWHNSPIKTQAHVTEMQVCGLYNKFPRKCFRSSEMETGYPIEVSTVSLLLHGNRNV